MKPTLSLAALLLIGAAPVSVFAGVAAAKPASPAEHLSAPATGTELPGLFAELDTDGNGQISVHEAKRSAEVKATFDQLDTNHDKQISLTEWLSSDKHQDAM